MLNLVTKPKGEKYDGPKLDNRLLTIVEFQMFSDAYENLSLHFKKIDIVENSQFRLTKICF